MEYKYELHCHTGAVSRCGRVEPEKIVEMYVGAGYNGIVVTDHYSPMTFPIHRLACPQKAADFYLSGYPRTDALFRSDPDKIKAIKQTLGLPMDKKVILYAPTWRVRNRFEMQMDLEKMRERLSDEYILLIRLHHFCAGGYKIPADGQFIFDLNAYNRVEDLYLISDLLITDYSSVMFDYALLHKPMLFFTYDLEEYSEQLRGMYVDIAKEAPGPLVLNTDQLVDTIDHLDTEMEKCRERYQRFIDKFLTYEQGDSCRQVVERVLAPKSVHRWVAKFKRRK